MPQFSIVIIAKDEVHTLDRLFQSLGKFKDRGGEIVLLDTGSTDHTVEIARDAGCRVYAVGDKFITTLDGKLADEINHRFSKADEGPLVKMGERLFHFAGARNHVTSLASNDFILHLDASDWLLVFDIDFFDDQISTGEVGNFEYSRQYASTDTHLGIIQYRFSRFYDRRLYHWQGFVHEGIYPLNPSQALPRTVGCTDEQLLEQHIKDESKPRTNYVGALALNLIQDPENPRWVHYVGRELYYLKRYRSAIDLLETHAQLDGAWNAERSESLCLAGSCYEALGKGDEVIRCYSQAYRLDSTRREPLLRLADLCQRQGDHQGSVTYAQAALAVPRTSPYFELENNYTSRPHALLYWGLFFLGRREEARQHWERCRQYEPDNQRFKQDGRLFGVQVD